MNNLIIYQPLFSCNQCRKYFTSENEAVILNLGSVKNSKGSMFTGDASIYQSSKDSTQLNKALNEDLKKFDIWSKGNKLSLNVCKSRSMLITTKHGCRAINFL